MNILILNSILYTGENNVIHKVSSLKDKMIFVFAKEFVDKGHNVTLIAAKEFKPDVEEEYSFEVIFLPSNFKRIFIPSLLPLHLKLLPFLWRNRTKYDLIISSEIFSFNSLFASIITPHKTIIWHELGQHNKMFKQIPSRIWYNIVAKCFMRKALVVARSPKAKRFVQSFNLRVYDGFISHGSDFNLPNKGVIREKQFIVVARLVSGKNIISIIQKFKRFIEKYSLRDYKLLIAGDGPLYQEISEYINANRMNNNITLLGAVPHIQLVGYLSSSLSMLCDSLKDLNMIAIEESLSVGTPVITNTIPYTAEWIEDNALGIAKDNWGEDDIYKITMNNAYYTNNCLNYSSKLSKEYIVDSFIKLA